MRTLERNSLLLSTLLAAVLTGCGGSPEQTSSAAPPAPPVTVTPPASPRAINVSENPFQLCFNDDVCTVTAPTAGAPQPYSYSEGPRPQVNPSTINAFPAFGWVVGTTQNQQIPTFIWQGNRLSGMDSGTLHQVTTVAAIREFSDRTEIDLNTTYSADTALLTIRNDPSGATEVHLAPPAGMADEGIAVTLFSIESPTDEGIFGMGARKDFFNQRGKLRNVWTEQQNTGLGSTGDLDFGGAGLNGPASPGDLFSQFPELDTDDATEEPRTSFPNGAQAAYWVEAFIVGARGWSMWTGQMHFQRLDLGATVADRIRWQVVDSDELNLFFADGGIEQASRTYTEKNGRAQITPRTASYQPWIDTLNQGEGEAAPNGQGFWGGQRARCEIESFISKSALYDIPFRVIGVEGWQVIPPAHPNCLAMSTDDICDHLSGFPQSELEWQTEVIAGTTFFNVNASAPGCDANGHFNGGDFESYLQDPDGNSVTDDGFRIAGYWNFFHTNPECTGDDVSGCMDDTLSVPLASKEAYYTARTNQLFVKTAPGRETNDNTDGDGNHLLTTNRGGISSIIDFTNEASIPFWKSQLERTFARNIDIFMHDFGELTTDDMSFAEGENITESHNLFAFKYQRAARTAIDEYKAENPNADFQPYFYARAGMTGACAFTPGVFPGDESTSWDEGHGLPSVIPAMLNLALSGCYAFTTDIGGYWDFTAPRTDEQLFVRWSQLSALTVTMRIHSSTFNGSVFPWTWAEGDHDDASAYDTIGIFRRYAKLKVNLIPMMDYWAKRAALLGDVGPVRPLILEDLSAEAQVIDYQWFLGSDIMVAPVVAEDATAMDVYMPTGGRWLQVTVDNDGILQGNGQVFEGGQTVSIPLGSDLADIPIFVRCGLVNSRVPVEASTLSACN